MRKPRTSATGPVSPRLTWLEVWRSPASAWRPPGGRAVEPRHSSGKRRIVVQANVRGRDVGSFVAEARAKIDEQVQLPEDSYVRFGRHAPRSCRRGARAAPWRPANDPAVARAGAEPLPQA
ncbi:MAG: hypothetical protein U0271_03990 [Polyangiaceae bacterium]